MQRFCFGLIIALLSIVFYSSYSKACALELITNSSSNTYTSRLNNAFEKAISPVSEKNIVKSTYIIGTEDVMFYPHFGKRTQFSTQFDGFAHGFFQAFSERMSVKVRYIPMPVKRLFYSLLSDESIDFKYPDNPNWQTALKSSHKIYYSKPISQYIDGTFILNSSFGMKRADIMSIGTIRGFTPEPYIDDIRLRRLLLVEYAQIDHMINALNKQRIDAIYVNIDVLKHLVSMKAGYKSNIQFAPHLPYIVGNYHLSTKNHPDVIELINQFIDSHPRIVDDLIYRYQLTTPSDIDRLQSR